MAQQGEDVSLLRLIILIVLLNAGDVHYTVVSHRLVVIIPQCLRKRSNFADSKAEIYQCFIRLMDFPLVHDTSFSLD